MARLQPGVGDDFVLGSRRPKHVRASFPFETVLLSSLILTFGPGLVLRSDVIDNLLQVRSFHSRTSNKLSK